MVLESLLSPKAAGNPSESFFTGFIYASLGLFLAMWVFEEYVSLVMIFLSSMASIPLLYRTIKFEEEKHNQIKNEFSLLFSHRRAMFFLLLLFTGAALAYATWYIVLPADVSSSVFSAQTETIMTLNQRVTGAAAQVDVLAKVFLNNVKVMIFCIIFSFIYGSGAIFILMWNASVIGAALGNFFRVKLAAVMSAMGLTGASAYLYVLSLSILRYAIHGVPEILAYIVAGLAGGIISVATIRHEYGTKDFERIILDASDLILLSLALLMVAAVLELYVTPVFF